MGDTREAWLVWMNDGVVAVHASRGGAEASAKEKRESISNHFPGTTWRTMGPWPDGQRWSAEGRSLSIPRLEIERRDIAP